MTVTAKSLPYQASRKTLLRATLVATAAAGAILTLFVLPAEYGIDPTGTGKALGLTAMAAGGEEGDSAAAPPESEQPKAVQTMAVPAQVQGNIEQKVAYRSDEKTLTLAPHTGVEVKAHMAQGQHLIFRWNASAPIRMDMHGEPDAGPEGAFTTYWKQKNLTQAQGAFTAPFAGTHGWYWRNGGETPVTLTVKTSGFYIDLFEPPAE